MQKTKSGRWQIRWRDRGKHRARTFRNKELAKKFEAELRLNQADTRPQDSNIKFEVFAKKWHEDYCKVEKTESQWDDDWGIIRNHFIPSFGDRPLSKVSKLDLLTLRAQLRNEKNLSPKTVNNIVSIAKKMMATAVDWEMVRANPFREIRPLKVPPQPFAFWTIEERDRFLIFCKRGNYDLWQVAALACHTGMRLGEIKALTRGALDFERKTILVSQSYCHKLKKVFPYTKGQTIRQIEMNEVVYEILREKRLMPPIATIFSHDMGHSSRALGRVTKKAGVKKLRFHDLRHTFASCLAMAGTSLQKIQALLGHTTIKQTMRYAHLHPDSLQGVTKILVRDLCVISEGATEQIEMIR